MSLVSTALRMIVCRTLAGETYAGNNVLDAPLEPLEYVTGADAPKLPTIAVFTGQGRATKLQNRELGAGERIIGVTIQIFLPPMDTVTVPVGAGSQTFGVRAGGAQMLLDFIWRQCSAALAIETGPWQKLYTTLVAGVSEITWTPMVYELLKDGKGIRVPVLECAMDIKPLHEPMWGKPLGEFWALFDATMRSEDATLIPFADMIKTFIENPAGMPEWRRIKALAGLSDEEIRASGISPEDATQLTEDAAILEDIEIDPAELTDQSDWTQPPKPPVG